MTDALEQNAKGVSIILDPLRFRSAGLASALQQWATDNGIDIDIEQRLLDDSNLAQIENLRLAIINLGGASVADECSLCAIRQLRHLAPGARIAIISDREDGAEVMAAFKSGAHGFIPTSTEPSVALQALSFVLAGGSFFPPAVLLATGLSVAEANAAIAEASFSMGARKNFTPSQLRVMAQLKEGKSNKLIARNLFLCEATVKLHVRQIMRKLGASNRTQVAIYCSTNGAVEHNLQADGDAFAVDNEASDNTAHLPNGRSDTGRSLFLQRPRRWSGTANVG